MVNYILFFTLYVIIAPQAPPSFISATSYSSSTIIVKWGSPSVDKINGIIDEYVVQYGRFDGTKITGKATNKTIAGNTTLQSVIVNLTTFVEYGFRVQAVTTAPGPFTEFAVIMTGEQ